MILGDSSSRIINANDLSTKLLAGFNVNFKLSSEMKKKVK